ncbi:MAG: hypothetical protein OK442_00810 [Thaumarchaeota archaeon]|nr:hypothetical protein [Nitrososphaerota archaeon]
MVAARRWAFIIVGLLLLLFGTVFALQGADFIKGSSLMSGNPTYIYVGAVLAVVGLVMTVLGVASRSRSA